MICNTLSVSVENDRTNYRVKLTRIKGSKIKITSILPAGYLSNEYLACRRIHQLR